MKRLFAILILVIFIGVSSCDLLNTSTNSLTLDEVIEGLKTALTVGTDSATTSLMKVDGYYLGDVHFVKIPLPDEALSVRELINSNSTLALISSTIGLDQAFENVILSVNRAAEDAARKAAPIFKNAITDLTISQGWDILNGKVPTDTSLKSADFDSTAATEYLKMKTYSSLTDLYAPEIDSSLDKDIVGHVSAVDAWNTLTTLYNDFMSNSAVIAAIEIASLTGNPISLPDQISTDLGVFSTQKALDGLFYMVGKEEKKIRKDPYQWASDILQKVFGSIM
jgi:hypothetical protein